MGNDFTNVQSRNVICETVHKYAIESYFENRSDKYLCIK